MTEKLKCDSPGSLITKTYVLLDESNLSLPDLFKETGIPFYWLRQFKGRIFVNPSVNRVQCLYEFLAKKELTV